MTIAGHVVTDAVEHVRVIQPQRFARSPWSQRGKLVNGKVSVAACREPKATFTTAMLRQVEAASQETGEDDEHTSTQRVERRLCFVNRCWFLLRIRDTSSDRLSPWGDQSINRSFTLHSLHRQHCLLILQRHKHPRTQLDESIQEAAQQKPISYLHPICNNGNIRSAPVLFYKRLFTFELTIC